MPAPTPHFELTERAFDVATDTLTFTYRLGDDTFTETFSRTGAPSPVIDPNDPAIQHLLDLAHLCVGVSYYKLTLPGVVTSWRPLQPEIVALVPHLYDHALRELAVRNDLEVPLPVRYEGPTAPDMILTGSRSPNGAGPLVPFGGGKDSTLTLSLLRDPAALTIHPTLVQRRSAAAVGVPLIEVTRSLDPLLARRTAEGGWNGHVPITAINSSVAAVYGALEGRRDVVIANERSADEPTRWSSGVPVNHQYSKTHRFEQALATAMAPAGMRYFSAVRRHSELAISGALAKRPDLRNAILSCNRVFSLTNPPEHPTWCRNCAKCRFTFLSFAVFLDIDEATKMFGGNLLDDPAQIDGVRALWSDKPFDCVGELAESAIALDHLTTREEWADTAVVQALAEDAHRVAGASGTDLAALLKPTGEDLVPPEYRAVLDTAFAFDAPH